MTNTNTINRGKLKRDIAEGLYSVKCNYRLTDDYVYDNECNFGKTERLDCDVFPSYREYLENNDLENNNENKREYEKQKEKKKGKILFENYDFQTKSGGAWKNKDVDCVTLLIHSNLSYSLRKKQ